MSLWFVLQVVLAFGFMIAIHEWGHFIACRLSGVRVERFAIGFGPALWTRTIGGTEYAVQCIPLGGYCKPAGGDLSGESPEKMYEKPPSPGEFLWAAWWKRVLIFAAGPSMNYVSAVVLITTTLMIGDKVFLNDPVLGYVPPQSLAERAGLRPGDRILTAEGAPVTNFYEDLEPVYKAFSGEGPGKARLSVLRGTQHLDVILEGKVDKDVELGLHPSIPSVIGSVALMTPARKAGLAAGDRVTQINGTGVSEWNEMAFRIRHAESDVVTLGVDRSGKALSFALRRVDNGFYKAVGISPPDPDRFVIKRMGFREACRTSAVSTARMAGLFAVSLGKLFTGRISLKDNLAGPVTILRTMYQKAAQGWVEFLNTVAFISLILCLMNLLPIPIVDGGQIVLCALEGVRRKPMSVKFQEMYQRVGLFLVVGLMGWALFNDIFGMIMEFKNRAP